MASAKTETPSAEILAHARRAAASLREEAGSATLRLNLCRTLLADESVDDRLDALWRALSRLPANDKHYWVGTFYTLLLPALQRRKQAAYFTPPHLSSGVVALARKAGFNPLSHTVIDGACEPRG